MGVTLIFGSILVVIAVFRLLVHLALRKLKAAKGISVTYKSWFLFELTDVKIEKGGKFSVEIGRLSISSSFLSARATKPITVFLADTNVVLVGEATGGISKSPSFQKDPAKGLRTVVIPGQLSAVTSLLLQFIGIVVENFTAVIKRNQFVTVVSATARLDIGSGQISHEDKGSADFILLLDDLQAKFLYEDSPILEIWCNISVRTAIFPGYPLNKSDVRIQLSKLKSLCNENLIQSLSKLKKGGAVKEEAVRDDRQEDDENVPAIIRQAERLQNIPQFEIGLEDCKAIFLSSDGRELSICWHCSLAWKASAAESVLEDSFKSYDATLDITGLVLSGSPSEKYLLIKQITAETKMLFDCKQTNCDVNVNFDTIHVNYANDDAKYWLLQFRESVDASPARDVNQPLRRTSDMARMVSKLCKDLKIKSRLNFKNCSSDFLHDKTPNLLPRPALMSVSVGEIDSLLDLDDSVEQNRKDARGTISVRDVYFYTDMKEIAEDSSLNQYLPCIVNDDKAAIMPSSEQHVWGRLFEFGSSSLEVKCERFVPGLIPDLISISGQASYITVELSCGMVLSLLEMYKAMELPLGRKRQRVSSPTYDLYGDASAFKDVSVDAEVRIQNLNAFLLGQREGGCNSLLAKVDSVDIATGRLEEPMLWEARGIKLMRLNDIMKGLPFFCTAAKFLPTGVVDIPTFSACFFRTAKPQSLSISIQETTLDWTPTVHMVLKELVEDALVARDSLKAVLPHREVTTKASTEHEQTSKPLSPSFKFDVIALRLRMQTTEENSFSLAVNNYSFNSTGMGLNVYASDFDVLFDEKRIIHVEEAEIKKMPLNHLQETRQGYPELKPINPRVWGLSFHSLQVFFPYKFDFANSLEKVQNIFKMLKLLHRKPRPDNEVESLPPDLLIHCENFVIEFEDDVFEIKLGSNYMLLMDEREQCIQRESKLREKLEKLTSTQGGFFSSKKYEEIFQSLTEKNAQIYTERSKMMYEHGAPKTMAFRCTFRGLELAVLADQSMHGKENVIKKMKMVNPDSPIPEDIAFSTLWCRVIKGSLKFFTSVIRDYPQPLMLVDTFALNGLLIGAERSGIEGATRTAEIEIDKPWTAISVKKNMAPLKFFYDLTFDMRSFDIAWGVNFEAGWATVSQSFDLLSKPTIDKSVALPFWDKSRLLFHGHLKMLIGEWNLLLSASKNPYNTTEKMVMAWQNVVFDWTNAKMVIDGDFDLHTRTASKYDDSQVLHLPGLCITIDMDWLSEGDPNDHHPVSALNPKKVNTNAKDYDSYSQFRSKNLNLNVRFESSLKSSKDDLKVDPPSIYLYASTFRWFQKYQAVVISNVSRPIKRGKYFMNVKPRNPTLGRHYKLINIDFVFPKLHVKYWGSFTKESGFQVLSGPGNMGISYHVHVSNVNDGRNLTRRPIAQWIITSLRSEVDRVQTDLLYEGLRADVNHHVVEGDTTAAEECRDPGKHFLFSVKRVTYNRQSPSSDLSSYSHKVSLSDFRGAWTEVNRTIVFSIFEAYTKMQMLKRVLSSDVLKGKTPKSHEFRRQHKGSVLEASSVPLSKLNTGSEATLLQKLLSEQEEKFIAQVEESEQELETNSLGEKEEDIIQFNWHIELFNSQVMLRGIETKGAILLTSAKTEILKRLHTPVAVNTDSANKLNKVSWSGKLENLQYFSTTQNLKEYSASTIPWITTSVIAGGQASSADNDVSSYMQSSDSVGSTVNVVVKGVPIALQRVISRCGCDFYYLSLDPELDPVAEEYEPSTVKSSSNIAGTTPSLANHLQVRHPNLEISTSPAQYEMFMDITQNLLLYTESKKKDEQERLDKMMFKLQLYTEQDLRGNILELQTSVRSLVTTLRRYERQLYDVQQQVNSLEGQQDDSIAAFVSELNETTADLQEQVEVTKEQLYADSEDLAIVIRAYKDVQKMKLSAPSPTKEKTKAYLIKQIDVVFDDMRWRMTQKDGQLGIADVHFRKFWYNKQNFNDNSCEHRLELGNFTVTNLIPDEVYRDILHPHEFNLRRRVDKSVSLRVYCRVKAPVAGISIKEHFEVNVCPIAVRLTYRFYHEQEAFFFPHKSAPSDGSDVTEFDLGVRAREETDKEEAKGKEQVEGASTPVKIPASGLPPPPPPPRPPPPRGTSFRRGTVGAASSHSLSDNPGVDSASEKSRKRSGLTIAVQSSRDFGSPPTTPSSSTPTTPSKTPGIKKGASFYRTFSPDESVDKMKERASKNQTFIYVKVPEIPICFSYKGEKDRNIADAHDFNLCLPTLEYHNRTCTWRDLLNEIKKDYSQVLVPQIIKEKLRLKGGWENKPSMAKADDEDKAKLLFGEKQAGTQKKAGKKLLFGKLSGLMSGSKSHDHQSHARAQAEKASDLAGKGVEPEALQETFDKLRTMSKEDG